MSDPNKSDHKKNVSELISAGSEIVGAGIGGVTGFLFAGPVGAAGAGIGGVIVAKTLNKVGQEISTRLLSPREKVRVGGVMALSTLEIEKRISEGETIRSDGFFDTNPNGRSNADEVVESVLLKSQREPEEKKLPYLAHLYANIAFSEEISTPMAHQLIKGVNQLTYRQLCILRLCAMKKIPLREKDYREESSFPKELYQVLYECFDLSSKGYINNGSTIALGLTDLIPKEMTPQALGADIHNFLQLWNIPMEDLQPIIDQLKQ